MRIKTLQAGQSLKWPDQISHCDLTDIAIELHKRNMALRIEWEQHGGCTGCARVCKLPKEVKENI